MLSKIRRPFCGVENRSESGTLFPNDIKKLGDDGDDSQKFHRQTKIRMEQANVDNANIVRTMATIRYHETFMRKSRH